MLISIRPEQCVLTVRAISISAPSDNPNNTKGFFMTSNNISEAQLAANRQNAQHSTGPTSEAGKARVGLNAVKTGLTGRTILLTVEEAPAYETLMNDLQQAHEPVGILEQSLVQSLVDITWRLDRIPGLEYAYVSLGYGEIYANNPEAYLNTPQLILEAKVRMLYEKEFRNLKLQENRLTSRREKELKELKALQEVRKARNSKNSTRPRRSPSSPNKTKSPSTWPQMALFFQLRNSPPTWPRSRPLARPNC